MRTSSVFHPQIRELRGCMSAAEEVRQRQTRFREGKSIRVCHYPRLQRLQQPRGESARAHARQSAQEADSRQKKKKEGDRETHRDRRDRETHTETAARAHTHIRARPAPMMPPMLMTGAYRAPTPPVPTASIVTAPSPGKTTDVRSDLRRHTYPDQLLGSYGVLILCIASKTGKTGHRVLAGAAGVAAARVAS